MTASSGPQFPTQTPVLIIGGGPVGLFSALSLARYGIPSTIVERQHTRTGQPKAHVLNSRSLEIFKQFGINTQTIRECAASPSDADVVRFVQSMTGVEYGNILYERQDEEIKQYTPEPLVNIEQPHIERILAEAVQDNELVSIWRGFQWQGCEKGIQGGEERIRSTILVRETGQEVVIETLNIPVDTPRSPFPSEVLYVSVELKADWRKYKSGILWMIMLKNTMQTFIAYDRGSHWVFAFMIEPDTSESLFTEEYCREKVDLAVGEKSEYEVLGIQVWTAYLRIAGQYRSPIYFNAFVLGDAAHTFPATGGLGLNTGVGDVQNLIWKIHAVESGWWAHDILGTYGSERRPVALMNSKQSDANQFDILRLSTTIATAMEGAPSGTEPSPEAQQAVQDILEDVSEFKDNFNCQVGYVYGSEQEIKGNSKHFRHSAVVGGRLPHLPITKQGAELSTLDLVNGHGFAVFASRAARGLPCRISVGRIPVTIWQIGRDFDLDAEKESPLNLNGEEHIVVVRPDQHIAGFAANLEQVEQCIRAFGRN